MRALIAWRIRVATRTAVNDGERVMSSVSVVIPCYNYGHFLRDAVAARLPDKTA